MKIVAYLYSDLLLEDPADPTIWGWDIDRVYQDLGAGPASPEERVQLQALIQEAQVEPPAYVLIRRLEELGDSVQAVRDRLTALESLGIRVLAIEQDYLSDPVQPEALAPWNQPVGKTRFKRDLIRLLAEVQQNQRSRRIRQGHAQNRLKAVPPPGKAPYGYRRGKDRYILDRSTAPVVKDFFEHFLIYGSLRGSVRYLAKKYGKRISVSTGRRWLTNPVYAGDLAYRQGDVILDTHAAIISREEAAQVTRLLRRNQQMPPRTASAPRSLSGLVTCAECQSAMTVTRVTAPRKPQEYLYLRPTACPKQPPCKAIRYEQVLQETIQTICRELPRAVAGLNMPDMERLKAAIASQIQTRQDILAQLPHLVVQGILDEATAELRAYTLRTEIAQIQSRLNQLPPVKLREIAQTVSIPQFWLDLSEAERRFYFREFIRQIQLLRTEQGWSLKLIFIF